MRIRDHREDDTPEINLIPLIDVVLCLIIFFVVTTTFDARSVLKLQLPQANGEPAEAQAKALSVLVNAEGRYFIDDREALRTDVESLKQTLVDVAGNDRDAPGAAARRRPHAAPGRGHRARCARPARLLARVDRHRAAGDRRAGHGAMTRADGTDACADLPPPARVRQAVSRLARRSPRSRWCSKRAASYGITALLKPDRRRPRRSDRLQHAGCPPRWSCCSSARGLFGLAGDYTMARSGRSVARDLRLMLMRKYFRLPGARFDAEPVASMLTRLGGDTEQVAQAAVDALKVMVSATPHDHRDAARRCSGHQLARDAWRCCCSRRCWCGRWARSAAATAASTIASWRTPPTCCSPPTRRCTATRK